MFRFIRNPPKRTSFDQPDPASMNVDKVPLLAARWSLDPAGIDERFLETAPGIAGDLPTGTKGFSGPVVTLGRSAGVWLSRPQQRPTGTWTCVDLLSARAAPRRAHSGTRGCTSVAITPPHRSLLAFGRAIRQNRNWNTRTRMSLDLELQTYPKEITLKDGSHCRLRTLRKDDEKGFHDFFLQVPESERMFIKHRVTQPEVIREWCRNIDLGRNLPLLA